MKQMYVAVISIAVALAGPRLAGAQPVDAAPDTAQPGAVPAESNGTDPETPQPPEPAATTSPMVPPWSLSPPGAVPSRAAPLAPGPLRPEGQSLGLVARPWWSRTSVWIAVGAAVVAISLTAYILTRDNDICGGCPRVDLR